MNSMPGYKIQNLASFTPLIAVICLLALTLGMCSIASPFADDFCRAALRLSDLPGAVAHSYYSWTGRWVEQGAAMFFPRYGFVPVYPAFLIALIGAYMASIYSFLSNTLPVTSWLCRVQMLVFFWPYLSLVCPLLEKEFSG
jgi:hypothetical protein